MQLFYASDIDHTSKYYTFSQEESAHCVRVLRLGVGDGLNIANGKGAMVRAKVYEASPKRCVVEILDWVSDFEKRAYTLHLAVAPTKNIERTEWFAEKATELGIDQITPLLCERSERKVVKQERLERVVTSAMKQSLKSYCPVVDQLTEFDKFIALPFEGSSLIAHCNQTPRRPIEKEVVAGGNYRILIGPEGDFTPAEVARAVEAGFVPVSLGGARLRTETAALYAVAVVSFVNG